jgi:magnesium transporter
VPLTDILALKHAALQLDAVVSDQLAVFDILQAVDKPMLQLTGMSEIFQIALGNARATDRGIDRLDSGTRDLQLRYDSAQQDKTNRRLAMLTILSAIFSPLTLLAGIYGMNFEYMPELGYRYAYFIVLGVMALIGSGLYWLLRLRGWLK